jgi:hypothetical protein
MRKLGLENVKEAEDFKRLVEGAYVCKITSVEDAADKEYLKVEYDIAEGEFKNYYSDLFESRKFWGGRLIRSYKESALRFFKSFVTAVENSNKGFEFDEDKLNELKGKLIGLVLGEEEYVKADQNMAVRLYVSQTRSVDEVRKGGIVPPVRKELKPTVADKKAFEALAMTADDELPF